MFAWLDGFQRRRRWAAMTVAVLYKFVDDQGYYLAALLSYYGFLSLFPLLLLLVTGLGFLLQSNAALQQEIVHSTVTEFPVIGQQIITNVHTLHGSVAAVVIGGVISVFGGLSVANVGQTVMNKLWAVPRVRRPNPLVMYLRSVLLLLTLGIGVLLTTALSWLTTAATGMVPSMIDVPARIGAVAAGVALNMGLFLLGFRVLTARRVTMKQLRAGALAAAVAWQALQEAGTYLVGHELRGTSASYGLFGIVLGLMAWLYLGSLIVVICAEINPVRANHLWPRSLLVPFDAKAPLTRADERAYASYATTEQLADGERIAVRFRRPDMESEKSNSTEIEEQKTEAAEKAGQKPADEPRKTGAGPEAVVPQQQSGPAPGEARGDAGSLPGVR
jgi:YihY family inner membrane protein